MKEIKFGAMVEKYMRLNNMTMKELGSKVNRGESTVSMWISGKSVPPMGIIQKLADIFGISTDMMVYGISNKDEHMYSSAGIDFIRVPLYPPICCGNGTFVEDDIIEYVPVPSKGLVEGGNYFCQVADGDSMKGAGINDGDLLVFEVTSAVNSGTIGCFCIDENEAMCKKYKEQNGMIILQPMNDEFDPIFIDPLNECFKCIGVLKKSIKDFE